MSEWGDNALESLGVIGGLGCSLVGCLAQLGMAAFGFVVLAALFNACVN